MSLDDIMRIEPLQLFARAALVQFRSMYAAFRTVLYQLCVSLLYYSTAADPAPQQEVGLSGWCC